MPGRGGRPWANAPDGGGRQLGRAHRVEEAHGVSGPISGDLRPPPTASVQNHNPAQVSASPRALPSRKGGNCERPR